MNATAVNPQQQLTLIDRELRLPDKLENPRARRRTKPMQVLNMSTMRTGSMSMSAALEILGYECYHGTKIFTQIRDTEMWTDALSAKFFGKGDLFTRNEWDQLLGDCSAVSADAPACCFAPELIESYPEAKVIVVKRPAERWLKSYRYIIWSVHHAHATLIAALDPDWFGKLVALSRLWTLGWMRAATSEEHEQNAPIVYEEHYKTVRRVTAPERLLEFRLEDGWEPLCRFLDKPLPNVPFPRVNDQRMFVDMVWLVARQGLRRAAQNRTYQLAPYLAVLGIPCYIWCLLHLIPQTRSPSVTGQLELR